MNAPEIISYRRGAMIGMFAVIESKMDEFISGYFVGSEDKEKRKDFHEIVLAQTLISFEAKKKIFYELLKKHGLYTKFPRKELEALQNARNITAHGAIIATSPDHFDDIDKLLIEHPRGKFTIDELTTVFDENRDLVLNAILELPNVISEGLVQEKSS